MKCKFLVPVVLSIVIGFFIGKVFFNEYDENSLSVFDEGEKIYFIETDIYTSLDNLKKEVSDYEDYLYLEEDDGYHLYKGITKNEENVNLIKEFYEDEDNNIYIREKYVDNYSFINLLTEYDKIVSITSSLKDLKSIERIVISNYKEMILDGDAN